MRRNACVCVYVYNFSILYSCDSFVFFLISFLLHYLILRISAARKWNKTKTISNKSLQMEYNVVVVVLCYNCRKSGDRFFLHIFDLIREERI